MKRILEYILFLIFIICTITSSNDWKFISTFLQHKHINLVNYYMCHEEKGIIQLTVVSRFDSGIIVVTLNTLKELHINGLRVLMNQGTLTHNRMDYFFHRFAFIINFECYNWQEILRQVIYSLF